MYPVKSSIILIKYTNSFIPLDKDYLRIGSMIPRTGINALGCSPTCSIICIGIDSPGTSNVTIENRDSLPSTIADYLRGLIDICKMIICPDINAFGCAPICPIILVGIYAIIRAVVLYKDRNSIATSIKVNTRIRSIESSIGIDTHISFPR